MIDAQFIKEHPEVDWSVYKSQQKTSSPVKTTTMYDERFDEDERPKKKSQKQGKPSKDEGDVSLDYQPSKMRNLWEGIKSIPGHAANAAEHPLSSLQDFGAGAAGSIQRAGASMGELGQYLSENYNPLSPLRKYIPESMKIERPNIRELAGLGESNPLKLEDALASQNNNPLAKALGQGAFGITQGGRSLLGQIGSNAAWGGIQAEPGERLEDAAISGALVGVPGALFKAPGAIRSASKYMQPGKLAEEFRSSLGEGTSAQNIETLSKRAQFAKKSAKEEALIPKKELYAQEGKSKVYDVPTSHLPEGNVQKFSEIIAPGEVNQYGIPRMGLPSEFDSLSGAIKRYRKSSDIDQFIDDVEDIFKLPGLSPKTAERIEDIMSMPTKRDSHYFNTEGVSDFYSKNGKLNALHETYKNSPTLENYDALQSALKKEQRTLKERLKNKTITDQGEEKLAQFSRNIDALELDQKGFMKQLPERARQLDKEFRQKYKDYAETYEKGGKKTGASETLRDLAEGRGSLVTDEKVVNLFSNPTAADKKAILDMGEGAAKNALYAALQKVPIRDASKMAKTLLDLKRTKGFDNIVTTDMETWAHNMIKHTKNVDMIKKALGSAGGAAAGGFAFGPLGAVVGAGLPFGKKIIKKLAK